ncbi:hypothetical protein ARMGADRAFT_1037666 [Armillaria gallica]|uniref:Uncharacterized protein n=1 Tax=Armillaria gallica TaxID=47427 RepID=A0A2H3CKV3_ARMGA|nr:hypothetical protein ARMGADRAFT_1037666 [Armillaria gallica]
MASFNIGAIKWESLPPTRLALPISTIELLAKAFISPTFTVTIIHFYLMLISPSSGGDLRIQLNIYCDHVNEMIQPYVLVSYCWQCHHPDVIPSGKHIACIMEFEVLEPTRVGDLLELLVEASLNTTTINMNNTTGHRTRINGTKKFATQALGQCLTRTL